MGWSLMRPLVLEQHHQYCPLSKHLPLQLAPRALSGGSLLVISLQMNFQSPVDGVSWALCQIA